MDKTTIRVRATAQGFMGRLIERGEVFTVSGADAFTSKWMEKVDDPETPLPELKYGIKSNGGGRWIVELLENGARSSVTYSKEQGDSKALAQAEANRLNAGGELILAVSDGLHSSDLDELGASTQPATASGLPDA
jgi:hypothetical protein